MAVPSRERVSEAIDETLGSSAEISRRQHGFRWMSLWRLTGVLHAAISSVLLRADGSSFAVPNKVK